MTAIRSKMIAEYFRSCLDAGEIRKSAIIKTRERFRVGKKKPSETSIYNYCRKFGVSTK